jgi:hypothetical protein
MDFSLDNSPIYWVMQGAFAAVFYWDHVTPCITHKKMCLNTVVSLAGHFSGVPVIEKCF